MALMASQQHKYLILGYLSPTTATKSAGVRTARKDIGRFSVDDVGWIICKTTQ